LTKSHKGCKALKTNSFLFWFDKLISKDFFIFACSTNKKGKLKKSIKQKKTKVNDLWHT